MTIDLTLSIIQSELQNLINNIRTRDRQALGSQSTIIRVSRRIDACEPLDVLDLSHNSPYLYWRERDGSSEIAGVGVADRVIVSSSDDIDSTMHSVQQKLIHAPASVRYFGGSRFNSMGDCSEEWLEFGSSQFILPRIEVIQEGGSYYLVANILSHDEISTQLEDIKEISRDLKRRNSSLPPQIVGPRSDTPNKSGWNAKVRDVLSCLEGSDTAKKIVLSRKTTVKVDNFYSPPMLLRDLLRLSPRSYGFIFSPSGNWTFLGASPERLFRRQGKLLASEALAGTTGRGSNQEHDRILADDLMSSRKNRAEHGLVIECIQGQLAKISAEPPKVDSTTTIRTGSVQHLYAGISSELKSEVTDLDVIKVLHPTPAVAGTPTELALEFIKEHEGYDRGWYSGPFGAVGKESSEFAVAIRSALLLENQINLYVGAGIVAGSDERSEWQELEAKLSPYLKLLGGEHYND